MSVNRVYKKRRRTTIELTSLLDLLFVMIFVSLIQNKAAQIPPIPIPKPTPKIVTAKAAPVIPSKYSVAAEFHFHATPGSPNLPSGKYDMQGSFNKKTGELRLTGINWLQRPTGYDMVPLKGIIEQTHTLFKGRVDFPGCKLFNLRRTQTLNKSPISGVWKGIYDCSQGPTGLTLTIQ